MSQIFHPSANTIAKASIFGFVFIIAAALWVTAQVTRSPYVTNVNVPLEQPVQFSHEHHVAGLGIDCRYCHSAVETSANAGMPSTKTCMTCHSQIWTDAELLEPVRASWASGKPIRWTRVNDVPDFAHFNHSIHVNRGVGCATCHGPVDRMPLMWKDQSLSMEWCLSCHRNPAPFLRPTQEAVFDMSWHPPVDQIERGRELLKKHNITPHQLTNCSVCHY